MPSPDKRPPLIVLIGPTAVGKTEISIRLAERLEAEIISADSRLFYRGMDIGTAKPSSKDRKTVPHHLIDFLDPDDRYSLAEFQREAYRLADEILARGRLPLVVGGTGQYIRALTEGWEIPAQPPDVVLRKRLNRTAKDLGVETLHDWLKVLDPPAAASIDPRNLRRTVRALEVIFSTGRRFSAQRRAGRPRYDSLLIGLIRPRPELYDRIDRRIDAMLADGLVDEVRSLIRSGYSPDLPSMSAIGYREISGYLAGEVQIGDAVASMKKRSRTLVRRQANWFKPDDPNITWIQAGENALEKVEARIRSHLAHAHSEHTG